MRENGGKYLLVKQIGKGGSAEVYLGVERMSGRRVAVKVYAGEQDFEAARAEWELMAQLVHPMIPEVFGIVREGRNIWGIMEYVPGESLRQKLERQGRIPWRLALEWGSSLCDVLGYLHERWPPVIYRDMKPANLMITPVNQIKLIDFGAAAGENYGTPGYAAPEQYQAGAVLDGRTDIYALGATLHHMVTGHNPCESPGEFRPLRDYDRKLPRKLEAVIARCLEKEQADRYRFCQELREELQFPLLLNGFAVSSQKRLLSGAGLSCLL